jgi:hypothetical protein
MGHKFIKKGRYASEEENGEDMSQILVPIRFIQQIGGLATKPFKTGCGQIALYHSEADCVRISRWYACWRDESEDHYLTLSGLLTRVSREEAAED